MAGVLLSEMESKISTLLKLFECPICLELLCNPVSTICDHKFCRHCIRKVAEGKAKSQCPLCNTPFTCRTLRDLKEWNVIVAEVSAIHEAFAIDRAILDSQVVGSCDYPQPSESIIPPSINEVPGFRPSCRILSTTSTSVKGLCENQIADNELPDIDDDIYIDDDHNEELPDIGDNHDKGDIFPSSDLVVDVEMVKESARKCPLNLAADTELSDKEDELSELDECIFTTQDKTLLAKDVKNLEQQIAFLEAQREAVIPETCSQKCPSDEELFSGESSGTSSVENTPTKDAESATVDSSTPAWEDSDAPSPSLQVPTPVMEPSEWHFTTSGINRADKVIVERFVKTIGARMGNNFDRAVTHIIFKTDKSHPFVGQRTLKYYQGIALKKWLVSFDWLISCLASNCLIPEANFEIRGDSVNGSRYHNAPNRSRTSSTRLLETYEICCIGRFHLISRDELLDLASACGAVAVQEPNLFSLCAEQKPLIIVEGEFVHELVDLPRLQNILKVPIVNKEWLLNSIAEFEVKNIDSFVLKL